jgi:hypothetical protein
LANNVFQVKRTSTSGRTPNTTGSYVTNSQYIAAGEFALNMADGILYTSNGSAVITVGSNLVNQRITNSLTLDNDRNIFFRTVNTSASVGMRQQSDDNFVFYSTNTAYGQRAVWSIFANSITSAFSLSVPTTFNGNVTLGSVALSSNGSTGSAGQVLTTNGSSTYWSTVGGSGTVTSVATGNGMTGGPVTTTGTVSVLANTGIVANATGLFVNATYIGTISANNTTFVNGKTEGNLNVNNATTAYSKAESALNVNSALTANNSTNLGGVAAASYQTTAGLSANVATLTANNANFVKANNGITSNSLGVFVTQGTGTVVNATGVHVNATYIATIAANNASFLGTVAAASYVQNTDSRTLSGNLVISGTSFTPSSNTILLGNSTQRWVLSANTGSFSGAVSGITTLAAGNTTITGSLVATRSISITNGGGTYQAGSIYADGNWGMLYRAAQSTPVSAQFAWKSSDDVTEYMRISPTGNVGIGNTAPNAKLAVTGTANVSGAVAIAGITTLSANIVLGTTTITANGGVGTAGQVLTSGATGNVYWASAAGGGYYKGGTSAVGSLAVGGQNLFRVNANTLNTSTTFVAGENAQATGPIAVASGITLTVESGARVSIV